MMSPEYLSTSGEAIPFLNVWPNCTYLPVLNVIEFLPSENPSLALPKLASSNPGTAPVPSHAILAVTSLLPVLTLNGNIL